MIQTASKEYAEYLANATLNGTLAVDAIHELQIAEHLGECLIEDKYMTLTRKMVAIRALHHQVDNIHNLMGVLLWESSN